MVGCPFDRALSLEHEGCCAETNEKGKLMANHPQPEASRDNRQATQSTEAGATAVEYALMVAFIAAVIAATVAIFGTKVHALFAPVPGWF
jgi:Flp pilus assembly pilin Flp